MVMSRDPIYVVASVCVPDVIPVAETVMTGDRRPSE
jgi:hypothetical protein